MSQGRSASLNDMDRVVSSYHRVLAGLGFFTLAAGDFWRYLLSWWGWGALLLVLLAAVIVELARGRFDARTLPPTLLVFLALATASIAWSAYPGASALGAVALLSTTVFSVFVVWALPWRHLMAALGGALRWILGLSILFELVVSLVVQRRVLPFWVDYSHLDVIPAAFYWSRNALLTGDRIQGIVGNANLLAMIALLALIVFALQFALGDAPRPWILLWMLVAVGTLVLTRSSTVIVATVVTAAVAGFVLLVRNRRGAVRAGMLGAGAALAVGAATAAIVLRGPLLEILGRSPDLTNRLGIWDAVAALAAERPVAGWGWMGYWAPWAEPLNELVVIRGVTYLQAHNAWLDVFLQLGALGLLAFTAFAGWTALRSWLTAIDGRDPAPVAAAIGPLVILTALLVQSLAESRLLTESGWALLVVVALLSSPAFRPGATGAGTARSGTAPR